MRSFDLHLDSPRQLRILSRKRERQALRLAVKKEPSAFASNECAERDG